jgi:hypothetical protein
MPARRHACDERRRSRQPAGHATAACIAPRDESVAACGVAGAPARGIARNRIARCGARRTAGVQPADTGAADAASWTVGVAWSDQSKTCVVGGPSGAESGSIPVRWRTCSLNQVSKSVVDPA